MHSLPHVLVIGVPDDLLRRDPGAALADHSDYLGPQGDRALELSWVDDWPLIIAMQPIGGARVRLKFLFGLFALFAHLASWVDVRDTVDRVDRGDGEKMPSRA